EGILAWAVAGAVEWFAHGLQDPETVRDATKGYRETSDALRGFIPGWFEVTGNAADVVSAKAVWTDYQTWTADEGLSDRERWRRSTLMEADRKSTRLNSSLVKISYAVFCLKK